MEKRVVSALIVIICSTAWLTTASPAPRYSFSFLGVLDRCEDGWATVQIDSGQEWLIPITGSDLLEGGVFHITVTLSADEAGHQAKQTQVSGLLSVLLGQTFQ